MTERDCKTCKHWGKALWGVKDMHPCYATLDVDDNDRLHSAVVEPREAGGGMLMTGPKFRCSMWERRRATAGVL